MKTRALLVILSPILLCISAQNSLASNKLCIDKIGDKFEAIDLKVITPPKGISSRAPFYIQKGKVITDEKKVVKDNKASYCEVEYTVYPSRPYKKIWGKNAIQHTRIKTGSGILAEQEITITPRPKSEWVAVSYRCPHISTYEQLKIELSPLIDVPCDDWGDLLPGGKKDPNCSPTPKK